MYLCILVDIFLDSSAFHATITPQAEACHTFYTSIPVTITFRAVIINALIASIGNYSISTDTVLALIFVAVTS
jgi:hypothetical protein